MPGCCPDCLVYTRGTKEDIDTWAALTGDESWGWDGVLPYFKKVRCSVLRACAAHIGAALSSNSILQLY